MADATIAVEGGGRVNNIGLMSEKQNGMILGGVVAGVGCMIFLAGEMGGGKSSQ